MSKLEYEKQRADKAEEREKQLIVQRNELRSEREEWKSLYLSERDRSTKLESSNAELKVANTELKLANQTFLDQRNLDKTYISSLEGEVKRLKRQRIIMFGISFVLGFGSGYAAEKLDR